MENQKKRTIFQVLGGATLLAALCFNVQLNSAGSSNGNQSGLSLETVKAFAQPTETGSCCKLQGSTCVVGSYVQANSYYKPTGACE